MRRKIIKEERQINILWEGISEEIFKKMSLKTGWRAIKIQEKTFNELGNFSGMITHHDKIKKLKNGEKIVADLNKLKLEMNNFKFPDFVLEKKGVVEFVEVKTSPNLNPSNILQKRSLDQLAKMGYKTRIQVFPMDNQEMLADYNLINKQLGIGNKNLKDLKNTLEGYYKVLQEIE